MTDLQLVHRLFELEDGSSRNEVLGSADGAVHDSMASMELPGVVEVLQALPGVVVARIRDPAISLLKH